METFGPGAAAHQYDTNPFRIGRAETSWAANGKVDQVRIYNVALSTAQIGGLYTETPTPTFRFPVSMTKGQQIDLLGDLPTPDGVMAAQSYNTLDTILKTARQQGARVIVRVTGANNGLDDATGRLDTALWKTKFNILASFPANDYVEDGTLAAHYAIDEPINDFNNVRAAQLEALCRHQKNTPNWSNVPCFVRELNTKLDTILSAGGSYQWVDAGWAAIADHHYVVKYNNSMRTYFDSNLVVGRRIGLGLMYGFNLINGGRQAPYLPEASCVHLSGDQNCAMRAIEIRELADVLAAIGQDQGCGVSGWEIDPTVGSRPRNYFFDQGEFAGNGIQSALAYLRTKVSGLRPGPC